MFFKYTRKKIINNCYDTDYLLIGTRPKILNSEELLFGDVLFSNSNTFSSKIIRTFTEGSYSHCAIYIGNNKIMDVNKNGGIRTLSVKEFVIECNYIVVTRVPIPLKNKIRMKSYINKLKNRSYIYNKKGAFLSFFKEFNTLKRRFSIKDFYKNEETLNYSNNKEYFCSELIMDIYTQTGYYETEYYNPKKWTPNGLIREVFFKFFGYMNKYNDLSKIPNNDYFLFGHPELLTKEGQNYHDKSSTDLFNAVTKDNKI
ncbi:MAG: hypothetical protein MJK08_05910 [Campylobacterales bacterium]|nr:hypothetical protein [Campylobacterales bacterium]